MSPILRSLAINAPLVFCAFVLAAVLLWYPPAGQQSTSLDLETLERRYLDEQYRRIMAARRSARARFSLDEEPAWSLQECRSRLRSPEGESRFKAIARLGRLGRQDALAVDTLVDLLTDREGFYYQDHVLPSRHIICGQEFYHYPAQLAMEQLTQLGAVDPVVAVPVARVVVDPQTFPETTRGAAAHQLRFMLVDASARSEIISILDAARRDHSPTVASSATCTMLVRGWLLAEAERAAAVLFCSQHS